MLGMCDVFTFMFKVSVSVDRRCNIRRLFTSTGTGNPKGVGPDRASS